MDMILFGIFVFGVPCLLLASVGWEKRFPRETDDLYEPDVRRQAMRNSKKDLAAEMERVRSEMRRR